jgi:hypothetical protein
MYSDKIKKSRNGEKHGDYNGDREEPLFHPTAGVEGRAEIIAAPESAANLRARSL